MNDTETVRTGRVRRLTTRLPRSTRSAGEARDFVTSALRSWGVADAVLCDVVLATSELVTNAIEHGDGVIGIELVLDPSSLLLRVRDETERAPVRKPPSLMSERSRGLLIVEALATAWGHEPDADGKWVWARFAVPGAPERPGRTRR